MTTRLHVAADTPTDALSPEDFAGASSVDPDEFQRSAMRSLAEGRSVVVAAPTGSGKTLVAEYGIERARSLGLRAVYTTPLKALSNQKFHDFKAAYGTENVGLLTGDHSVRPDAPVVVMTTEVLRNMVYADPERLDDLGVVVLDEVHYLQDRYRGGVWEEVIILLDPEVALVCLSATVSNAEEFAEWVGTVRGGTEVVISERRPVPLEHLYCVGKGDDARIMPMFDEEAAGGGDDVGAEPELNPSIVRLESSTAARGWRRGGLRTPRRHEVAELLDRKAMLPAIYFIFSRLGCDRAVRQLVADGVRLTGDAQRREIRRRSLERVDVIDADELDALGFGMLLHGLEVGLAPHHAGMVPPFRELVEELFCDGLVPVVFATETLSLGINMPARTVVIEKLTKFGGERHEPLTPGQYTQLAGRAGRRGIDPVGKSVVLWSPFVPYEQVARLVSTRTYELQSSFRPTYNMAANLVARVDRATAHHIVNSSFAQFRTDRSVVRSERDAETLRDAVEAYRERATCTVGDIWSHPALRDVDGTGDGGAVTRRVSAALRPGDVVRHRGRPAVVVMRVGRGGRRWRLLGVDGRMTVGVVDRADAVRGHVGLPEPVRTKEHRWRSEAATRLRRWQRDEARAPRAQADEAGSDNEARTVGESTVDAGPVGAADDARHPCDECPEVRHHLRWAQRALRAQRDLDRLERRIDRRTESLSRRFDAVVGFLTERGYVEDWDLTPKGELLALLYSECDLVVAEAISAGVFDDLDPAGFAAVLSLVTYEARRDGPIDAPPPSTVVRTAMARLVEIAQSQRELEKERRLESVRELDGGFAAQADAWVRGRPLDDVIVDELGGGDFVRNVKQLVDMCRQVADALRGCGLSPSVEAVAREAADRMWRGVVAVSTVRDEELASPGGDEELASPGGDEELASPSSDEDPATPR